MILRDNEKNEFINISLFPIFTILKKEHKIILLVTLFFSIIGFFYALSIPKEYASTGKIMPEVPYKPSNGMGGLYELLKKYNSNIDLYNTEITTLDLYVEIINTTDFYNYILSRNVKTRNHKEISFKSYYYYNVENKELFPEKEKSDSNANNKIKYYSAIQDIQRRIVITTTKKNNIILVTAKMPDPSVAADITNFTITYLMEYITKYRTEKARQELHFIENLQKNIPLDSLTNEPITKEIQNSLLASIVQMKIKIQEDTPIFQVLEKAQIPVANINTPTSTILIVFIFIGFFIGIVISFLINSNYKLLFNSN